MLEHITDKTKLLVLPFPNNPTGATLDKHELEEIAQVCIEKDIYVLSDEIYSELSYKEKHISIACIPGMKERTVLINGFSKAYAMTGWRLGYACAPHVIMEQMIKLHQFAIMCAPTVSQYAAVEALKMVTEMSKECVSHIMKEEDLLFTDLEKWALNVLNHMEHFMYSRALRNLE